MPRAHDHWQVPGLQIIVASADTIAAKLTRLALAHGIAGYDVDVEAYCCTLPPGASSCPACDTAFSEALAVLFAALTAALHPHGKTLSMDVNEHGSGYLRMENYPRYLATGVSRLRQMGTYGLSNTSGITEALLSRYPIGRIGFGTCTLSPGLQYGYMTRYPGPHTITRPLS